MSRCPVWLQVWPIAVAVVSMIGAGFTTPAEPRVPQIELKAPGAFDDPSSPAIAAVGFNYQINATVLIPLLVVSVPVVNREGVGAASAVVRDVAGEDGVWLRTYEFFGGLRTYELFAASAASRSRGLNRLGFLREAVRQGRDGVHWTAHFGVVSSRREATREEVEEHLDGDARIEQYSIFDGFTDDAQTWSATVQLDLEGPWSTAAALYADLRPRWALDDPDEETTLQNEGGRTYLEPVGFLGALQHSLSVAAVDVERRGTPRRFRYSFVHNAKVFYLDVAGHSLDDGRRQRYVQAHLVDPEARVHKFDYRIVDNEGDPVQSFELWTELATGDPALLAVPILPLAFEFKARPFLKLRAVRVLESPP